MLKIAQVPYSLRLKSSATCSQTELSERARSREHDARSKLREYNRSSSDHTLAESEYRILRTFFLS